VTNMSIKFNKGKRRSTNPRYASRLTSKYQATIPKEIRAHLHLECGDEILYELLPDNTVIMRKTYPIDIECLQALNSVMNEWESQEETFGKVK
jgi:antitoxin PrlF